MTRNGKEQRQKERNRSDDQQQQPKRDSGFWSLARIWNQRGASGEFLQEHGLATSAHMDTVVRDQVLNIKHVVALGAQRLTRSASIR